MVNKHTSVYDSFIDSISVIADGYYIEEIPNLIGGYDLHVFNRNLSPKDGSLSLSSALLESVYEFCISEEGSKCDYMVIVRRLCSDYVPVLVLYIKPNPISYI